MLKMLKRIFLPNHVANICCNLEKMGVVCHVVPEGIYGEIRVDSSNAPINRIVWSVGSAPPGGGAPLTYLDYFIPDADGVLRSEHRFTKFRIDSIRIRKFPIFGNVVGVRWEGDDGGLDIFDRLTNDIFIRQVILDGLQVRISADEITADERGWKLGVCSSPRDPSKSEWDCFCAIGNHLLSARFIR